MGLSKTTHIETESGGRIVFSSVNGQLELEIVSDANVVTDKAALGEDDLRTLLKDSFPAKKRGPRAASANESRKKKNETHVSA